jgi:hypothetical protein
MKALALLPLLLLCFSATLTGLARADVKQEVATAKASADTYQLDLTPPDLSAFALLDVNPNQVTRPGTVRELSAALLNGVKPDGTIVPGVAIEWSPVTSVATSLADYRKTLLLRRLTLSAASVSEGAATRSAVGLRWVIKDDSDPLADATLEAEIAASLDELDQAPAAQREGKAIIDVIKATPGLTPHLPKLVGLFDLKAPPPASLCADEFARRTAPDPAAPAPLPVPTEADRTLLCELVNRWAAFRARQAAENEAATDRVSKQIEAAKERARKKLWNELVVQLAAGVVGLADDGRWESLEFERFQTSLNLAVGMGSWGQFIARVDYSRVEAGDGSTGLGAGGRLLIGTAYARGGVEGYTRTPGTDSEKQLFAATGELRLGGNVWLELQVGAETEAGGKHPAMVTRGNIKYGAPE